MKRITTLALAMALAVLSVSVAYGKRAVPRDVPAVTKGSTEYRAPRHQMGCVEAWDTTRNKLIWRRQIYVVRYTLNLERDVQDVFIKTMELKGNTLVVKNERKSEYRLDLQSLEVKVAEGTLVEQRPRE